MTCQIFSRHDGSCDLQEERTNLASYGYGGLGIPWKLGGGG